MTGPNLNAMPTSTMPNSTPLQVAEGVATASSVVQLIEKTNRTHHPESSYPIIFCVRDIVEGKRTPAEGLRWVSVALVSDHAWDWFTHGIEFSVHVHRVLIDMLHTYTPTRDLMSTPTRVEMWTL